MASSEYSIKLRCRNIIGWSDFSKILDGVITLRKIEYDIQLLFEDLLSMKMQFKNRNLLSLYIFSSTTEASPTPKI